MFATATGIITTLGSIAVAIGGIVALAKWYQAKKAGQTEARLAAAEREAERAKSRERIESDVRGLGPDGLERMLGKRNSD